MTVTCPKCKEKLPPAYWPITAPQTGEQLECGMCGHVWRFRLPETNVDLKSEAADA
jgi:transcription elongation factor Elf1